MIIQPAKGTVLEKAFDDADKLSAHVKEILSLMDKIKEMGATSTFTVRVEGSKSLIEYSRPKGC